MGFLTVLNFQIFQIFIYIFKKNLVSKDSLRRDGKRAKYQAKNNLFLFHLTTTLNLLASTSSTFDIKKYPQHKNDFFFLPKDLCFVVV